MTLTIKDVLEEVELNNVIALDNDSYSISADRKFQNRENWPLFDYITQYHPELIMEEDESAGVMWVRRKNG